MKKHISHFSDFQKGVFFTLLSILFMVIAYVLTRYGAIMHPISGYNLAFWSCFGAILLSVPYILIKPKSGKQLAKTIQKYPKALSLSVLLSFTGASAWFYLITIIPSDTLSLFDQTTIIWSIFLGVIFLGEKMRPLQWAALFIAMAGVYIVSEAQAQISTSVFFLLLLVPLLYGLQSLVIKKYGKGVDSFSLAWLRGVGMTAGFAILLIINGEVEIPPFFPLLIISLAQFSGIILNRLFYIQAHEHLPISQLNFFYILVPILVFLISPFIEQDFDLDPLKYMGATLVIAAIVLFIWKRKTQK